MADIDMIPRSYRDGVRVRRTLRRVGLALAAILLAAASGHAALRWNSAAIERKIATLRDAASAAQSDLARAAAQRDADLREQHRAALLGAVRREGELARFALAIDSTLPAETWLTAITLRRDMRLAQPGAPLPDSAEATDSFATGSAGGDVLLLNSNVELRGQAASYQGITDFLASLSRAPGLKNVQLQASGADAQAGAIDFHATLAVTQREDSK